ncbi:MAG: transposase, partial [Thermodesulfobacteriota bacterium]|nr:transposase [Thermodesulfobacteriota bacterium]
QSWNVLNRAVKRGFGRKEHRVPARIGVDEKSIAKGHKYESLVYDIDAGTVEYVCDDRGQESLEKYYRQFSDSIWAGHVPAGGDADGMTDTATGQGRSDNGHQR